MQSPLLVGLSHTLTLVLQALAQLLSVHKVIDDSSARRAKIQEFLYLLLVSTGRAATAVWDRVGVFAVA